MSSIEIYACIEQYYIDNQAATGKLKELVDCNLKAAPYVDRGTNLFC
jgi:hypothetical protein